MFSRLFTLFSYCSFSGLNKDENKEFIHWRQEQTYKQITYISLVTGMLYIFLSFINRFTAPTEFANYMANIQFFLMPPYIFIVSYLAYKKKNYLYIELLLFFAPIYATFFHLLIQSKFHTFNIYQVELYMMIFWIFTISGLRLVHATIIGIVIFIMGTINAYAFYSSEFTYFVIHIAWMTVSLIFGFSGGYLLEESQKSNFLKQKELQGLAMKDKLTGLYNRLKLDEVLVNELEKSKQYNHNLGVIILDIDFFKEVNDNYGHQIGDEVLIAISTELDKTLRFSDSIFRWGGEEFIILCLEVDKNSIERIAQNVRQKVESIKHTKIKKLTISLGTTISNKTDTMDSIIKRADEALYLAKNSGRNCVKSL